MEVESVACNLCGSADTVVAYSKADEKFFPHEVFDVCECRSCGLAFVNPRPTMDAIAKYYPREYFEWYSHEGAIPEIREPRRVGLVLQYVENAGRSRRPRLLDIGCGNGDFPRAMKNQGWDVEGLETSGNAILPIDDFPIHRVPFSELEVDGECYDVITAWAVLEHVHDPMAYFERAAQLLSPGGLFIFLVNNHASFASRWLYREDVPRHLYFFTEQTVSEYLRRAGLELVDADFSDRIYELRPVNWSFYLWYRLIRRRPMRWQDVPESRTQFAARRGGNASTWQYVIRHPLATLDRAFVPLVERIERRRNPRSYGVATYVARKPRDRTDEVALGGETAAVWPLGSPPGFASCLTT